MTQAKVRQYGVKKWASEPHWWSEEARRYSHNISEPGLRSANFPNEARR
jgi:hypothetical protein